jgi:hypothetical protein
VKIGPDGGVIPEDAGAIVARLERLGIAARDAWDERHAPAFAQYP